MKHTILFLAANPTGTDRLALDREARAIQHELERATRRDSFDLVTRWAVEPLDLLRELRKLKPTIIHFSGHGGRAGMAGVSEPGARRSFEIVGAERYGLYFQKSDGSPQVVTTEAIAATFGAAGASVRVVVLNACYGEMQATALTQHVDCVVGMQGSILDTAARSFAVGFYGGLGERASVDAAFLQGCAAISLEGGTQANRPTLRARAGVDPKRLVLAV